MCWCDRRTIMHLFLLLILQATAAFAQIDPGECACTHTRTHTFDWVLVRSICYSVIILSVFSTLSLCLGYGGWTYSRRGHHSIQPMVRDHWTTVCKVRMTYTYRWCKMCVITTSLQQCWLVKHRKLFKKNVNFIWWWCHFQEKVVNKTENT